MPACDPRCQQRFFFGAPRPWSALRAICLGAHLHVSFHLMCVDARRLPSEVRLPVPPNMTALVYCYRGSVMFPAGGAHIHQRQVPPMHFLQRVSRAREGVPCHAVRRPRLVPLSTV